MSRVYLVGMTQNEKQNIKELTDPIWEHVDGLIFVDHGSIDGTRELLEERKGVGKVLDEEWVGAHDYSMNHFLLKGPLQHGDWFIIRDSMERFDPDFAKDIKKFLATLELKGVRSIFYEGKGFAFKWNDSMVFQGSPHWGLQGQMMDQVEISDQYPDITWRIKDGEEGGRPIDNKINHEAKYAWTYGRSNHLLLGLEDDYSQFKRAELIRLHVRDIAKINDFELTTEGLINFMKWAKEQDIDFFSSWINSHKVWKNFYRYHLLEEPFEKIEEDEWEWEFKKVLV